MAKKRPGPKRKPGIREPNGQLSRRKADMENRAFAAYSQEQKEIMETGLAARERMYGMPRVREDEKGNAVAVSRDQRAGSFVGRLCMSGEITVIQHDAAMRWLEDWANYSAAINAPKQPGAVQINDAPRGGGANNFENVSKNLKAVVQYDAAKRAVQTAQYEVSNGIGSRFALLGALWHVVQQDMPRHDMLPELRTALNVLVRHYGLAGVKAA